jgi:hypothetical protein
VKRSPLAFKPRHCAGLFVAAVVGVLVAAFYSPVWTSAINTPRDFGIAILAFLALVLENTAMACSDQRHTNNGNARGTVPLVQSLVRMVCCDSLQKS